MKWLKEAAGELTQHDKDASIGVLVYLWKLGDADMQSACSRRNWEM